MKRPLTARAFHILVTLADRDRHGYAIKQEIARLTNGELRLGPATLYETLHRLEADGLLRETEIPADADREHSQRRYYRLTRAGREILASEVSRQSGVLEHARRALSGRSR